jgi:hypothetical protein
MVADILGWQNIDHGAACKTLSDGHDPHGNLLDPIFSISYEPPMTLS